MRIIKNTVILISNLFTVIILLSALLVGLIEIIPIDMSGIFIVIAFIITGANIEYAQKNIYLE